VSGLSWGGHTLCSYATQYPDAPAGLIFCNTEAQFNLDRIVTKMEKLGGKEAAIILREYFTNPSQETEKRYLEHCVPHYAKNAYTPEEINRCTKNLDVARYYAKHEALQFNFLSELHKIKCPSLFMVGEKSPIHPVESAEEMATQIDQNLVSYNLFSDSGAPVYKDSTKEAYRVVYDFIKNITV